MIGIIYRAIWIGLIAFGAAWLSNHPGHISAQWLGYQVDTSVAVLIGAILIFYFVFYTFLAKPLVVLSSRFTAWTNATKRAEKLAKNKIKERTDAYELYHNAVNALEAGKVSDAEKYRAEISLLFADDKERLLPYLAKLAEKKEEYSVARPLYDEMMNIKNIALLGFQGALRVCKAQKQNNEAVALIQLAKEKHIISRATKKNLLLDYLPEKTIDAEF
ncbi:MAG: hypothetical protein MJ247_04350 [Alphaproteobacteria bacterium]|nr:hypothetical protein [Alphaproteobacteria bacterium]